MTEQSTEAPPEVEASEAAEAAEPRRSRSQLDSLTVDFTNIGYGHGGAIRSARRGLV
jgi:hypothetical protein